jgi:hypothetical protein
VLQHKVVSRIVCAAQGMQTIPLCTTQLKVYELRTSWLISQ